MKCMKRACQIIGCECVESDELCFEFEAGCATGMPPEIIDEEVTILKRVHPDILRAVTLMRPFYKHLDNNDRRRLMDWFANELSRKGKK